jgi:Rv2175c C-terminal domain of unknown function
MTTSLDGLVDSWLTVSQVAAQLDVRPSKVRQLAREHELVLLRPAGSREPCAPAELFKDGAIVKGLGGTLTLLADHGLDPEEAVEWLFTADDSLPGRPIDALREDRGTEVRRRAQVIV